VCGETEEMKSRVLVFRLRKNIANNVGIPDVTSPCNTVVLCYVNSGTDDV